MHSSPHSTWGYVGDDASNLQRIIRELSKHEKSILMLEKRLCEQEERHKKTENQLKNEINCLKKEICQLRYVVLGCCGVHFSKL